jgi:hypothetical protein
MALRHFLWHTCLLSKRLAKVEGLENGVGVTCVTKLEKEYGNNYSGKINQGALDYFDNLQFFIY